MVKQLQVGVTFKVLVTFVLKKLFVEITTTKVKQLGRHLHLLRKKVTGFNRKELNCESYQALNC